MTLTSHLKTWFLKETSATVMIFLDEIFEGLI